MDASTWGRGRDRIGRKFRLGRQYRWRDRRKHGIDVYTTGQSVTIPDLSSAGIGLQPGASYTWTVFGDDLSVTTDDLLAAAGPKFLAKGSFSDSTTGPRTFVVQ